MYYFERFSYTNQTGEETENYSVVDRVELPRINHATGVGRFVLFGSCIQTRLVLVISVSFRTRVVTQRLSTPRRA